MTRRVVVTGLGIVSSLGNSVSRVLNALQHGYSGLAVQPSFIERGMRSHVAGVPDLSQEPEIPRRARRFMADSATYAYHAMLQAIHDAGLSNQALSHPRVGLIMGAGVGSLLEQAASLDVLRTKGLEKIGPYSVPKVMTSTASANLASEFGIQGMTFSVSSACASSGHALGLAADYIRWGKQDVIFAGGSEEVAWPSAMLFDGMGVLSTRVAEPRASCPYDADRDGFVIAGGAGFLVLEELEHAKRRNATVYAELTGYGVCSDGGGMVNPDPKGAERAMRQALEEAGHAVQYINTHATSTSVGDLSELRAIESLFGAEVPLISSTKGLSGHAIGAAAVHEAIYSMLMLQHGFVVSNANLDRPDPACKHLPLVRQTMQTPLNAFMTNSFGFGGTNVSLVFKR